MKFDKEVLGSLRKAFEKIYTQQCFSQSIIRCIIKVFAETLQRQSNFMESLILSLTNSFESKYFLLPAILIVPVIPKYLAICDFKLCPSLILPFLLLHKKWKSTKNWWCFSVFMDKWEREGSTDVTDSYHGYKMCFLSSSSLYIF